MDEPELLAADLDDDEWTVLRCGLLDWLGPARPTDELALAMGFTDRATLSSEAGRLMDAVEARTPLTVADWKRVLVATEIAFASDVFGSGLDWRFTTGFSDAATISLLRSIQRKLPRWRPSVQFTRGEDGEIVLDDIDRPLA